jgi:glycerol-3-phosphate dehydrogenase
VLLYTGLAFDRNRNMPPDMRIPLPSWLSRDRTLAAVPWLDSHQLQGAFAYHDTLNLHPERLLLAFLQSAVDVGAQVFNHMQAVGFLFDRDPAAGGDVAVQGLLVLDRITGERHEVRGRTVVNAAGPWMDLVLSDLGRSMGVKVNRSKGVHLLTYPVAGQAQVTDTVFARARNGHHVIVSPWQGYSFIGPTDTHVDDAPDAVRADEGDVELILDTLNDTISDGYPKMRVEDIEATTVGIRPLIVDESKDSYATSRRHELYNHAPSGVKNLWSIGGGKWTTGRALGVETVKTLLASDALRGAPAREFDSRQATAHGAFAWAQDAQPYFDAVIRSRPTLPLDDVTRLHLARLYGTDHELIFDLVEREPSLAARISERPGRLDIAAQVAFAVTDEAAYTLSDALDRRLVIGTLGRVERAEVERVAEVMAPLCGWSAGQAAASVEAELRRRAAIELRWRGRAAGA